MAVDEICDLLQVHANRDKVVYLVCYGLKFWGAASKRPSVTEASARLAATRAALRLFDDAAVIRGLRAYGLGRQDGPWWGSLGLSHGVFTLAYLQAEKLIFLLDTGILKLDEERKYKIKTAHKLFWGLYTFVGFVRETCRAASKKNVGALTSTCAATHAPLPADDESIRTLHVEAQILQSPDRPKCAPRRFTQATLTSTKLLLDVIHVVSWLPPGWLWGSAMQTSHAAGIATFSGILSLAIHYHGKRIPPR